MDSTLATIMYYLLHILAVFGLVFLLILLVRVTFWCLMCNLKEKKKHNQNQNRKKKQLKSKLKLKSLKNAEEGQATNESAANATSSVVEAPVGPPTLRRSPNVQRLNLIKPEDDQLFKNGMEKKKKESSTSNEVEEEVPPTPPPPMENSTAIEMEDEKLQQESTANPVYATLAFSATAAVLASHSTTSSAAASRSTTFTQKRKAPSPPVQRIACICPYCTSMNKAKEEAAAERAAVEEKDKMQKKVETSNQITPTKNSEEVAIPLESAESEIVEAVAEDKPEEIQGHENEEEIPEETHEENEEIAEEEIKKDKHEEEELPPLPETPRESPSPVASSTQSLDQTEQNALNSLDQAIEELDDAVQDLNGVKEEVEVNGTNEEGERENDVNVNQEVVNSPQNTTVVTVEINAVIEPEESLKVENLSVEKEEVNDKDISDQQTGENGNVEEPLSVPTEPTETPSSSAEPVTAETSNTTNNETSNTSSDDTLSQELQLKNAEPKTTKSEEPEIAFFPPKPSEIKKRESLRRRQQQQSSGEQQQTLAIIKPRIIESVNKVNGNAPPINPPPLPYKPIRLARTVSAPVKKTPEETNGYEPQCAIYARVIDQIKQRVSYVEPPSKEEEDQQPSAFDDEEDEIEESGRDNESAMQQAETVHS